MPMMDHDRTWEYRTRGARDVPLRRIRALARDAFVDVAMAKRTARARDHARDALVVMPTTSSHGVVRSARCERER